MRSTSRSTFSEFKKTELETFLAILARMHANRAHRQSSLPPRARTPTTRSRGASTTGPEIVSVWGQNGPTLVKIRPNFHDGQGPRG